MPWKPADADDHVKGLSAGQKRVWARVANSALAACEEAGKPDCEGTALRQAASVAKGMQEGGYVIAEDGSVMFDEPDHTINQESRQDLVAVIRRAFDPLIRALKPEPHKESDAELTSDLVPLVESAVREDGTMAIKIIEPGWGNSGYYSADVLKRDAGIYAEGTQMFLDHPSISEAQDRPERSVRDLVGTLATPGRWEENGVAGPGVYADAKVVEAFRDGLGELAPDIGLSHRMIGKAVQGEAEGREGSIIEAMVKATSVDFVTKAAAGGKVLELMESVRSRLGKPKEHTDMPTELELKEATDGRAAAEKERDELKEAGEKRDVEMARLQEAGILREAKVFATEVLSKVEHLPELTQARLVEFMCAKPPVKEGALDKDAFTTALEEAAKSEIEHLAKLTSSGSVRGMGAEGGNSEADHKALEESVRNMHPDWTDAQVGIFVKGR